MALADHDSSERLTQGSSLPVALVFAYSCEPGKGSEPGAGWGMLMAIRQIAVPIVLMRPDSMPAVETWLETDPGPHPEFVVVEEPRWVSRVRRNRIAAFLMYLAWLRRAKGVATEIVSSRQVDLVHHVTYSPYWLPTPAVHLGVPSVLGPVGGAVTTPKGLVGLLGLRGRVTEAIDRWSVLLMEHLPSTRRTWRAASIVIVQNDETRRRTEGSTTRQPILFNHAMFHVVDSPNAQDDAGSDPYVVWLSPMDSRKGPELAIRALAASDPLVRLVMVGDGPELDRMTRLARDFDVRNRIEFIGRVDHDRALELMSGASAAIFTGLREEGGLALTEALYLGTPTIVLDLGGPSVIAAAVVDPSQVTLIPVQSRQQTISELARAMSRSGVERTENRSALIDRSAAIQTLRDIYAEVLTDRSRPRVVPTDCPADLSPLQPQVGEPVLSVVMPAYNAERFIGAAIDSVLNQTVSDLELIIVEDGSSDRTWQIIQGYAGRDERITAIRNATNMGIARSLNRGVAEARALRIGRLDADDIAVPDRFEKQLSAMAAHPEIVVVGSNALHFNENGKILGLSMAGPTSIQDFRDRRAAGDITMVLDGTSMFRRDIFELAGPYDPDMDAAPEVDLFSRMAAFGAIVALEEPLIRYRLYTGSNVTRSFFAGRVVHRFVAERERARVRGYPQPAFDEFCVREAAAPVWRRARNHLRDAGQYRYRTAGVLISEGQMFAGVANLATAFVVSPRFVTMRVWRRRLSASARHTIHDQ